MEVFPLHSPENVFHDFRARRAAIIKALTCDVEKFYQECDPEKESLCLYGLPTETWEVKLPEEYVPPDFPEPTLGINFARDKMDKKDWLALVAQHSDAWLLSVAFYFGARFGFGKEDRKRLFAMINYCYPTIYEVVTSVVEKPTKEESTKSSMKNSKLGLKSDGTLRAVGEEGEENEEERENTLCGACGIDNNAGDEFWICCDACEKWFHGKCVKITAAQAEHIKQYKCPVCSNKRARA